MRLASPPAGTKVNLFIHHRLLTHKVSTFYRCTPPQKSTHFSNSTETICLHTRCNPHIRSTEWLNIVCQPAHTGFSINVRTEQESTKPYGAAFENNTPSGVTFSDNLRIFAMPAARAVPHTALHRDKQPLPAPPVHGLLPGCLAPKKDYILYLYDDHRIYRRGV